VNLQSYSERQRYDGWFNNLAHPDWGSTGTFFLFLHFLSLVIPRAHTRTQLLTGPQQKNESKNSRGDKNAVNRFAMGNKIRAAVSG
jgi:hypothetical protein